MGHCLFMRKGETHTAPAKSFAGTSWADIITACQTNTVPEKWLVGDQKSMTINGTDYLIDIIGKNHDDYADGSGKAPLTFQLHDCLNTTYQMNSSNTNVGGWTSSELRSRMSEFLGQLDEELQKAIKPVIKLTSAGNKSSTINTTSDKLFLLSEVEIFGSTTNSKSGEGSQYAYYKAGNSKVKKVNGSAYSWWERSPRSGNTTKFCLVDTYGGASSSYASNSNGVSFAFCF